MAQFSPTPFSLSDFIQRIFPTIIAACLFVPFYSSLNAVVSPEGLIFGAAILGYIVSPVVIDIAYYVYKYFPFLRKHIRDNEEWRLWLADNWKGERFFYSLSKDEKESLYLNGSYTDFFRTVSFYLFVYSLINLIWLLNAILFNKEKGGSLWSNIITVTTPMYKNWQAPTLIILIISAVLFYYMFKSFLLYYGLLFFENGENIVLAEKYHRTHGNLAINVWGKVIYQGEPIEGAEVKLIGNDYEILDSVRTNSRGYFKFKNRYNDCLRAPCVIFVTVRGWQFERTIILTETVVPYFEIRGPTTAS
jgi:hypothetical protein